MIGTVFLVRQPAGGDSPGDERRARQILDVRFAPGQIDEAEYERRRRVLEESRR